MKVREASILDLEAISRVNVDTWRLSFRGLVQDAFLDKLTYARREKEFRDFILLQEGLISYVAEEEAGGIVGHVFAGPEREGEVEYLGEVYALYVLPQYQRRGVGTLLFEAALEGLKRRGTFSLILWTLSDSPFRAFYESFGGAQLKTKTFEYEELKTELVAYGWPDIREIPPRQTAPKTRGMKGGN